MGICTPRRTVMGLKKRTSRPKIGSSICAYNLLAHLPNQTGLYPHPEQVVAFSLTTVFRCKFTFTYSKAIQEFQLQFFPPSVHPKIASRS